MPIFRKKSPEHAPVSNEQEIVDRFLNADYLEKEYIVPPQIDMALRQAATALTEVPEFVGIVNVGGTANGSYALRLKTGKHTATDLDFYLVGDGSLDLAATSDVVAAHMKETGIGLDGELNGTNPNNYLDLSRIDEIIDRGDAPLLALVFQSFYGKDVHAARRKVLDAIMTREDAQEVWDEVASFHIQSLSLHHGSFSAACSQEISDEYYPKKIDIFELPMTPEEALANIDGAG